MKPRIFLMSLLSVLLLAAGLTAYAAISSPNSKSSPEGCPATEANGSQPPGESVNSPSHLGNGALWTVLPEKGLLSITPD
jgi:hypothetical protein